MAAAYTLKTRPPTGRVPWPLILIEGGEKSGKSWAAATLSASPRVGRTFWIDLGEGAGDEYGAIPGVRYEIVEHDGEWHAILGAVQAIRDLARQAADAGEPPVVLVIDSMTAVWESLKDWASNRAASTDANKRKLRENPNVEIVVSQNFWNDANARHRRLMTTLMTFPGIAVITARGKEVTEVVNGKPVEGKKIYRVEGQKDIGFDSTCWVRLSRDARALVIGARSVHTGIRPGIDPPQELRDDWSLEWLVFEALRCDPAQARPRDLVEINPGNAVPDGEPAVPDLVDEARPTPSRPQPSPRARELFAAIVDAADEAALRGTWEALEAAATAGEVSQAEAKQLAGHVKRRKAELDPATPAPEPTGAGNGPIPMVNQAQHRRMHALWRDLGLGGTDHREDRLTQISMVVEHDVDTSSALTFAEAERVIAWQEHARKNAKMEVAA